MDTLCHSIVSLTCILKVSERVTMKVVKVRDNKSLSENARDLIVDVILSYENPVLGLATGSTPEKTYHFLVEQYLHGAISFSDVTTFNLDEYVGLSPKNPFSYWHYMNKHLFSKVNIKKKNVHIPDGLASDLEAECLRFEEKIKQVGPIHLQILGVGLNGHIGFNEPGTSFQSRTHVAKLTQSTREVNSRFFNSIDEVPKEALTMGIGTIMEAEQIVLLVQGDHKKEILKKIIYGEVTEEVPASVLQTHPNAMVITDIDV